MGSPEHKETPGGVPVLERDDPEWISGTPEYKARIAKEAEDRRKKAAGWKYVGTNEYTGWVAPGKHQSDPKPATPKILSLIHI